MPTAAPHPCPGSPSCSALVTSGYCPTHTKAKDAQRPSAAQRGYDAAWTTFSKWWLAQYPWCGQRLGGQLHAEHSRCVQRGQKVKATRTDHILSLRDGGAHRSPRNSQSLCNACNIAKAMSTTKGG
jgi:5-methylcytosine-specific restriction protein A